VNAPTPMGQHAHGRVKKKMVSVALLPGLEHQLP
jgi:hypothetical protein